jgi:SAM-dependent methyltransferase
LTGSAQRYDTIGTGYAQRRREDPRLRRAIEDALVGATSVVNVGAGAGSYEPADVRLIPIEPSGVMVRQRSRDARPAVRAVAAALPLPDACVEAAMTVLSLHHWEPHQREGVAELCRVARRKVVIVTIDPAVSASMWLLADYLPEVAEMEHRIFPPPRTICSWIDRDCAVRVVPVPRDTPDEMLLSFWAHPERVADASARAATSGFARQPTEVVERVVRAVEEDLQSGAWERRHGHLRQLAEYDAGLRLIDATLAPR